MIELVEAETDDFDRSVGDAAIEALAQNGYCVVDGLLNPGLIGSLNAELAALDASGVLAAAAIGREGGRRQAAEIRRAAIHWFDGGTAAERRFLEVAERLRSAINRRLFLGLFDFECNFIAYPTGGFYGRHLDSLSGARNRVVSMVIYLDPGWQAEYGGILRLWESVDEGAGTVEVVPQAGRVVLMMSEEIPHEVLPAHRPRHAVAGWWRVNASTGQRLDTSR
ncbi:MAG: 2OG-Fe(II) oxygenase [Candidatus Kaistia colombiensis]|nr:MAG: 2OG-Fe(II) oxygenase [Kaistia sp.]